VCLTGRLRADDGGPTLVLQDGGELFGFSFTALVDQHHHWDAGVGLGQVAGLHLDRFVADARVEFAHVARHEWFEDLDDHSRRALI
jgi:hypothetical protein